MTWAVDDQAPSTAGGSEIESSNAPVWILGVAVLLALVGVALRLFCGLGGAAVAYGLGLLAFGAILLFRRRYGVLSQTTFVQEPAGLNTMLIATFFLVMVEIVFAVWPIATEFSRG